MMKKGRKNLALLLICLIFGSSLTVFAATEKDLEDTKEKLEDLQEQKKETDEKIDSLEDSKGELESSLSDMDKQLTEISSSLTELEGSISEKEALIEETEKKLAEAEERSKKQYEDMKQRIRFMYENGDSSLMASILNAGSISEFLNRTEYVEAISRYDREKLKEYQETQQLIADSRQLLQEEQAKLEALKQDTYKKQQEMSALIASTKENLQQSESEIDKAKKMSESYAKEIEEQKAYEAKLEQQKAQEDAARMEEIKKQEEEGANGANVVAQAGDLELLAALIQCESEGEPYEGKLAVGSVVLNRVASSYFPNSVVGVIYQSGQFSPVASGRFATVLAQGANGECTQAAQEVLGGRITTNALYFRRNTGTIQGTVIGNHVFY